MRIVTYQEIMLEAEMGAAYLQGDKDEDQLDAPLNYAELAWLYDMIIKIPDRINVWWFKEHAKE